MKDYTPVDRFPDFDAGAGGGPVQLQQPGEVLTASWTFDNSRDISAVANTTPIGVTTGTGHVYTTGQKVEIIGSGVANAEGVKTITVTSSTTFTLDGSTAGGSSSGQGRVRDPKKGVVAQCVDGILWLWNNIGAGARAKAWTWLGTQTIVGSGGTSAVVATGNGTAAGITTTGGSTSGYGVGAIGGAPNGHGVGGVGTGTGVGGVFTGGASGRGVVANAGVSTQVAVEIGVGNAKITGAQPAKTADPGADGYLCATNVVKAWAQISVDGSGGLSLVDGYNISGVSFSGGDVVVAFARPFADQKFAPVVTSKQLYIFGSNNTSASQVQITAYDPAGAGAGVNLASGGLPVTLYVQVCGRQ